MALTPAGKMLWFSWKPQMFSIDDVKLLEGFAQRGRHFDAVLVHKGLHAASDWRKFQANGMPEAHFLEEQRARATLLADLLVKHIPKSHLIWRDAYHNHLNATKEATNQQLRNMTTTIFREQGFTILPGHDITAGAPAEFHGDGLHPEEPIVELLLTMLATVICPESSRHSQPRKSSTLQPHGGEEE